MASTINTTDDLIRLLTENAEFYQAVRRLILTDELIRLPERFAAFANRVDDFIVEQRGINAKQQEFNAKQQEFNAEQQEFNAEQRSFNRRIEDGIGELKGNAARSVINAYLHEIAAHLGLTLQGSLSRRELGELIGPQGRHADVSSGDRASFIRADLVIIAADSDGDAHNIALEASYTADLRDTRRARRNAELLERLTGRSTQAMIASVRNDREAQAEIDRGAVAWYPLDPDDFTPE